MVVIAALLLKGRARQDTGRGATVPIELIGAPQSVFVRATRMAFEEFSSRYKLMFRFEVAEEEKLAAHTWPGTDSRRHWEVYLTRELYRIR
jgi:hypothetical protein